MRRDSRSIFVPSDFVVWQSTDICIATLLLSPSPSVQRFHWRYTFKWRVDEMFPTTDHKWTTNKQTVKLKGFVFFHEECILWWRGFARGTAHCATEAWKQCSRWPPPTVKIGHHRRQLHLCLCNCGGWPKESSGTLVPCPRSVLTKSNRALGDRFPKLAAQTGSEESDRKQFPSRRKLHQLRFLDIEEVRHDGLWGKWCDTVSFHSLRRYNTPLFPSSYQLLMMTSRPKPVWR